MEDTLVSMIHRDNLESSNSEDGQVGSRVSCLGNLPLEVSHILLRTEILQVGHDKKKHKKMILALLRSIANLSSAYTQRK